MFSDSTLSPSGDFVQTLCMKAAASKKARTDAELLDRCTSQLLRAVKEKMLKKHGRVDQAKLRKEGYSERFLSRLDEA